jgi:hypothetical protein
LARSEKDVQSAAFTVHAYVAVIFEIESGKSKAIGIPYSD